MSDIIYYKNGEETFRISPPTVGTKCPETKLEVKKMNEIQKVKAEMKMLEKKLSFLEELEKTKSPVEEAFKKVYGEYPMGEPFWVVFKKGYEEAQKDYKVEEPEEELKTLYQMFYENDWNVRSCEVFCDIVKEWMSQYADNVLCKEYKKGYEYCLTVLEENLK